MPEIVITVRNKEAEASVRSIVTDNTDYTIRFDLDADWEAGAKIVYFALQGVGALAPVTITGTTCKIPAVHLIDGVGRQLAIGLQQGEVITSRAAYLWCFPSAESELLNEIVRDGDVTMSWLSWVNENMARAETNVTEAEAVLTAARAAANEAEESAQSAAIDAAAARISAQTIMFPVFSVDADGHVIISYAERLGTTTFLLTDAGHLEVTV